MRTRIVSLLVTLITLNACAKNNGGPTDQQNIQSIGEQKLQGNWVGPCKTWNSGPNPVSGTSFFTFSGSTVTIVGSNYNSTNCSGSITTTLTMKSTFVIPSVSAQDPTILDFDVTYLSLAYMVLDQDTANLFNTGAICGFTDWVIGVAKDVSHASCFQGMVTGKPIYSITKVTDTQLQLGTNDAGHDGTSLSQRHVSLSADIMTKKN